MCKTKDIDSESWSSTSPPAAPAPLPFIVDALPNASNNPLELMFNERDALQQQISERAQRLAEAEQRIQNYLLSLPQRCYLLLSINRVICDQQIVVQLFNQTAPRVCEAFRSICENRHGYNYENSSFHYIIPNRYIIGGQIDIYCRDGSKFFDTAGQKETSSQLHDRKGLISMDLTNSQNQFVVTLGAAPMLDDHYVVFGEIISGTEIFDTINSRAVDDLADQSTGGQPSHSISIVSCGVISNG